MRPIDRIAIGVAAAGAGAGALWGAVALLAPPPAAAPARAAGSQLDYLIQDVCVDAADRAVPGDPARCARHRDLKIGEPSPFILTDYEPRVGHGQMALMSFPLRGTDGSVMVMTGKAPHEGFGPGYVFRDDPASAGYDLTDTAHSPWVSMVRTWDPSCGDQVWSASGAAATPAARAGGWILFPRTGTPAGWPASGEVLSVNHRVQITADRPGCGSGQSPQRTRWFAPRPYMFEAGKRLAAIRTDHFASSALGAPSNAMERFYFTREYGFTRWENWVPQRACLAAPGADAAVCHPERPGPNAVRARCSVLAGDPGDQTGLRDWGGQPWVRTSCNEFARMVPLDRPQRLYAPRMAREDGYVDVVAAAPPPPAAPRTWAAAGPSSLHQAGAATPAGWAAPADGQYRTLTYGPYAAGLPAGRIAVTFTLIAGAGGGADAPIADIDVYRDADKRTFAKRTLRRADFAAPGRAQRFPLTFDYDGTGLLEFRVITYGNAPLTHVRTEARRP